MKNKILLLLLTFTVMKAYCQTIVINEIMQSNIDCLMVDNDFPDSWVELYNPSPSAVNVGGWSIGLKDDASLGYQLPPATVPAHGHLLVYCDKEDNGLHTNFRIDSGKGTVYLFTATGDIADAVTLKKMPSPNVAYGRISDSAEDWHYEYTPTPGSANDGGGSDTVLPQPVFSIKGGILVSAPSEWLIISIPEDAPNRDDLVIHYSKDSGKEPTEQDAGGAATVSLPINGTTVIRAKIFSKTGEGVPSRSVTQSYIFHPRATTMPVVSLVTDAAYFNDNTIGILSSNVQDNIPNYMRKWRRPLNVEFFDPQEPAAVFNQLAETAVSGVSTREESQKSLKIYANKRFGTKDFAGPLWDDKPEVTTVKSFVLRNGGNNSSTSRINDALVQKLFGTHVDNLDWQAYRPVIVYLNGKYFGEYALRERSDEDFVESNYGIKDIVIADETSYQTPEPGTLFEQFCNAYHNAQTSFDELSELMDIDNFLKALCCEVYGMNTDYPMNNVAMWHPINDSKPLHESIAPGKWRWILKDLDRFGMFFPLYPESFDMISYIFSPDDLTYGGMYHFDLYKRMVRFPEFRDTFIDHMAVYLGDFLRPALVNELCDIMADEIREEVKETFLLYHYNYSDFTENLQALKNIIASRNDYLYSQLSDFFHLSTVVPLTISRDDIPVTVNDIPLTSGDFSGKYFSSRSLRLSAPEGCQWKMTVRTGTNVTTTVFTAPSIIVSLPSLSLTDASSLHFDLVSSITTGADNLRYKNDDEDAKCYNLLGQQTKPTSASLFITNGKKVVRRGIK